MRAVIIDPDYTGFLVNILKFVNYRRPFCLDIAFITQTLEIICKIAAIPLVLIIM